MNPILEDYLLRFKKDFATQKPDKFFSQLELVEINQKLPYIFGVEVFCYRVLEAMQKSQKICIYSDYDTDAVTATATMYWGLIDLGVKQKNLSFYAPDRFTEGYGMNPEAIQQLCLENDLIISVDCGINSTKEAEVCRQNQTDLIITDHHHLQDKIPEALAVINPRLSEYYSQHPEKFEKPILKDPFLKNLLKHPEEYSQHPEKFLTSSATGVTVAWFCLLWVAYYFEYLEEQS